MSVSTIPSSSDIVRVQNRRRIILTVVLVSVGIHVIAAIVAGILPSRPLNSKSPRTSEFLRRSANTR